MTAEAKPRPSGKWLRWLVPFVVMAITVFPAFRRTESLGQALIDTAIAMSALAVLIAIVLLVERLTSGRARLWARIAELSIALGAIVFTFGRGSTATLVMAGAFWLFVTAGLVLLAALRPEVST